jgi:saposin
LKRTIIKNLDDTPECTLCHYVVTYLDAVLKTNKSEAAVEAALEKVCTILPSKERAQCNEFVKTYGPVLAQLIAEVADPDTICRYLGLCQVTLPKETSTKKPTPVTYPNHDYVRIPTELAPITCTICQFIISRMKHFVTLNQTEEEILVSLKESCDLFSVIDFKQQCQNFLDQYGPYIIQMISSDVQPKVACQSLGICEKTSQISLPSTRRQSTPPVPVSTSTLYGKCIFGMSYWCTSRQNAELCNAVELCQSQVWSKKNKNIVI